jgi:hypothetical protein
MKINPRTALWTILNGFQSPRVKATIGTTERTRRNVLKFSGNHNNSQKERSVGFSARLKKGSAFISLPKSLFAL